MLRITGQCPIQNAREIVVDLQSGDLRQTYVLVAQTVNDFVNVFARNGSLTSQHLVQHKTRRKDIGSLAAFPSTKVLWGHVARSPHQGVR